MADKQDTPYIAVRRSPLGRALGLGAARQGSAHWWAQRANSAALIPLTIWFIFSVWHLTGASREGVAGWLSAPWTMGLMIALVVATFHHTSFGLQVVIEDYVHEEGIKTASLLAIKGLCIILALICIVSVLKIGL